MANKDVVMHEKNLQTVSAQQRVIRALVKVGVYFFLGVMALIVIFPFYWTLITSVKDMWEAIQFPPTFWPSKFVWSNYVFSLLFNVAFVISGC